MPEMTFTVRWPDGSVHDCYSPSLVMHDHLEIGASYPVSEFADRAGEALALAAARVEAKFGFSCTSALQQRAEIEATAARYDDGEVLVLAMHPPLPEPAARSMPRLSAEEIG